MAAHDGGGTSAAAAEAADAAAARVVAAAEAEQAAAAAEAVAEAVAAEAVCLRDEARESLREVRAVEAEASKAEELARAEGGSQKLGVSRAHSLAGLSGGGGNPSANAALFRTMSGGVPPQPPQPGQAMLSHIRKLNLSQEALQPRPASVARALSRARGEMSETERAARSSASTQEPRSAAGTTDPMQAKPACSA